MTEQRSQPRPDWDQSLPGRHPALNLELTPEERQQIEESDRIHKEALELANSAGQNLMSAEQRFLARWKAQADVARASLEIFLNPDLTVEDRDVKIIDQRQALVTAYYKLGWIEDALEQAAYLPDAEKMISWILYIQAAIDHEDCLEHHCARPAVAVEAGSQNAEPVQLEYDRRWSAEEVFSSRHQRLVHVWVCSQCGEANATAEVPERQRRYTAGLHKAIDKDFTDGKSLQKYTEMMVKQ